MKPSIIAKTLIILACGFLIYCGWENDERLGEVIAALCLAGWGIFYASVASEAAFKAEEVRKLRGL